MSKVIHTEDARLYREDRADLGTRDVTYIRQAFLKAGFSNDEAWIAVDQHLDPRNPATGWRAKLLLQLRHDRLVALVKYGNMTRAQAVKVCEEDRLRSAENEGLPDTDLFAGAS